MSWISEAANGVADGASDGAAVVADQWDSATDALSDPEAWIAGQASASWDLIESAGGNLFDPVTDALGAPLGEIVDLDDIVAVMENAAETIPDVVVDVAAGALAAIPEQYADALSHAVEAWDRVLADVDRRFEDIVEDVMRAATALEGILQTTLSRLSEAIEQTAQMLDLLTRMLEGLIYFLGRALRCLVDLVAILGGCVGGTVAYYVWKATVVIANSIEPIRQIPEKLQKFLQPVFPEFSTYQNAWLGWSNIWLVEDAWIGGMAGAAFVGVTYKGIRLSSVVYVDLPLDLRLYGHVSNVAHELEHVRQMTRFVSERAFACAYGAGWLMGGGYAQNPFERAAFELECRQRNRILKWVNNVGKDLYENPCNRISEHNPCSEGFK